MASTTSKDLYSILGVEPGATPEVIKKSYRELAKRFHPDRTGGDKAKENRFKEVSAAYEVLSDPKRREQYDAMRRGGFRPGAGEEAYDFSAFQGVDGLEDLFSQIFGGQFSFGGRRGGGGGGRAGRAQARGGGPRVVFESSDLGGFAFGDVPPVATQPAPVRETIVRAHGHDFVRRGDDVTRDLELAIDEAVLGVRVSVPTLEGHVTLTIPAGTSSGQKLRLRGKGMRRADGSRGDQYVVTKIVVPASIDTRAAELIREFAARAPSKPRR